MMHHPPSKTHTHILRDSRQCQHAHALKTGAQPVCMKAHLSLPLGHLGMLVPCIACCSSRFFSCCNAASCCCNAASCCCNAASCCSNPGSRGSLGFAVSTLSILTFSSLISALTSVISASTVAVAITCTHKQQASQSSGNPGCNTRRPGKAVKPGGGRDATQTEVQPLWAWALQVYVQWVRARPPTALTFPLWLQITLDDPGHRWLLWSIPVMQAAWLRRNQLTFYDPHPWTQADMQAYCVSRWSELALECSDSHGTDYFTPIVQVDPTTHCASWHGPLPLG